jgi:cytochrome c-type biogenesis protein CcmH/NrfG
VSDTFLLWLPGIIVLLVGASSGLYVAAFLGRDATRGDDDVDDLESRRENLIALLRDLEAQRDVLDPAVYATQKAELEARAVEVTHARDRASAAAQATVATAPEPTAAVSFLAERPQLQGVIWGAVAVLVVGGIYLMLRQQGDGSQRARDQATRSTPNAPALSASAQKELDGLMARLTQNPQDIEAFVRGGQVMLQEMRLPEARTFIDRALQLDPEHPQALIAFATLLVTQGDTPRALTTLDGVLQKSPDFLEALYLKGMIAAQAGNDTAKQESLKRFIAKAPDGPQKLQAQAVLDGKSLESLAPRSPTRGSRIWDAKCAVCHGEDGQAETPMGRGMGLPNMSSATWQAATADDAIKRAIREGFNRERNGRKQRMQAFPNFTDAELDELVKTIRAFPAATP